MRPATSLQLLTLLLFACENVGPVKAPRSGADTGDPGTGGADAGGSGADGGGADGSGGGTDTGAAHDTAPPSAWVCPDGCDPGRDPRGDCDADGLSNADEVAWAAWDPPWLDPCAADVDLDGVRDCDEVIWGLLPFNADSDGDGQDDAWALIDVQARGDGVRGDGWTTIPVPGFPDADADGIPDLAEGCIGTRDSRADTDGDGLLDGEDVWRGCEPLQDDTDRDGWTDGTEAAAGASCRDPADHPGFHSVFDCDAVETTVNYFPTMEYYPDREYWLDEGPACMCEVRVPPALVAAPVGGVSVFQATSAHSTTTWGDNPYPLAVAIVPPSRRLYLSEGRGTADAITDDTVAGAPVWMAFGDPAVEDSVSAELTLDGVWTVAVSLVQSAPAVGSDGEPALRWTSASTRSCEPLSRARAIAPVQFRFDPPPAAALAAPALPPGDPRACRPGERGVTRFALVDVGPRPRLVRTGGAERYAGARPERARVLDWRGADQLEAGRPGGGRVALGAGAWSALPVDAALPELRWASARRDAGPWRSPIVEIEHRCDAPPAVATRPRYRLSWAALDAAARAAAGVGLSSALGADPGGATPIHVAIWPADGARAAQLQLLSPGVGALISLELAPEGPGQWRVAGGLPAGLRVDAWVRERPDGLELELRAGAWTSPLGELPIGPARLSLPRVGG